MIPVLLPVLAFGGFAADESSYLSGKDQICQPISAAADGAATGPPACQKADKKEVQAAGFAKPARGRKLPDGRIVVAAVADDGKLTLTVDDRPLVRWDPPRPVRTVNPNLHVSPSGNLVAVDADSDTVVFDVSVPLHPPRVGKGPASQPAAGGNAFDRAVGKGGVWEQRIVPCDQAGVLLKLDKKKKRFTLAITTKCQGDKRVTDLDGAWTTAGADQVELTFENEGGPTESMQCRLDVCEDSNEDCLTCQQEDVTFTLQVVRR